MTSCVVLMDPIELAKPDQSTDLAILLEAQARGYKNYYLKPEDVVYRDQAVWGFLQEVSVFDDSAHYYELKEGKWLCLADVDLLFMRKDPPVDQEYWYLTYLLEWVEAQGVLVVNSPRKLREANEKLFAIHCPDTMPKTLVTMQMALLEEFINTHKKAVVKPLDGMGGQGIFTVKHDEQNKKVILQTLTKNGTQRVMVQEYLPAVSEGDKRILMVAGKPVSHALARIPAEDDFRGNISSGATVKAQELSERDQWLASRWSEVLQDYDFLLVGLDVIGDYVTEVNVTSPTCARQLKQLCGVDVIAQLFDMIESRLSA